MRTEMFRRVSRRKRLLGIGGVTTAGEEPSSLTPGSERQAIFILKRKTPRDWDTHGNAQGAQAGLRDWVDSLILNRAVNASGG